MDTSSFELSSRLNAAHRQFASIRERFDRPGVERGGCRRDGVTPVYVRKFGEHAATIFPNLTTVEASFDTEQLQAVTATLLAFKTWVTGRSGQPSLAERIVDDYLSSTRPYFVAALLRATEDTIAAFLAAYPDHAPVIEAIFCVAGSEGFRDLVRLYDARDLEHAITGSNANFPDILAFVNLHERTTRDDDGKWRDTHYEVWCPGFDLAKEFHAQCVRAAETLVTQHQIVFAPPLEEEVTMLPDNLVTHFTQFVRTRTTQILHDYLQL